MRSHSWDPSSYREPPLQGDTEEEEEGEGGGQEEEEVLSQTFIKSEDENIDMIEMCRDFDENRFCTST